MENLNKESFMGEILTRKEAANYLRVCLTTLDKTRIKSFRIGKSVRYQKSELDKWIEKKSRNPNKNWGEERLVKGEPK
jgi:excisionase family DNA binding protein